ncbi:MAG TPA: PrgI family protein [Candidatus Moranbacteria bacterium]|nr:PrgI family protein [Candidatus Moranbacteria bacterium]
MLINVPQHIDVEDKIVGPLTAKQLGWVVALGIILLILWNMLPKILFFIVGVPLVIIFLALAFYKPYGQPLGSFVIFGIMYFFRPKVYFWKRTPQKEIKLTQKSIVAPKTQPVSKSIDSDSLKNLAQLLDSEGTRYNEDLENILKKPAQRK